MKNNHSTNIFKYTYFLFLFSGESAFHAMMAGIGWAKYPMVNRIDKLNKDIPITLLYGSLSWIDHSAGQLIKEKRSDSYVQIQVIPKAGHHVYADRPDLFNQYVNEACEFSDNLNKKLQSLPPIADKTESDIEVDEATEVDGKRVQPDQFPTNSNIT